MSTASEARQALIDLATLTRRELFEIWQALAGIEDAAVLRDALMEIIPALGDEYGAAAAALAADWYDDLRAEAGVAGRFLAEPVALPDRGRYESLVRWGVSPLFAAEPDRAASLTLIEGGLQRTVADQHRLTVVENTKRDSQAKGWRRVGVGGSCGFCRMLIDRGHVFTEESVTFRSHDHCNCAASPTWDDNVVKVSTAAYEQSTNRPRSNEARRKRNQAAYAYIREQYGAGAL